MRRAAFQIDGQWVEGHWHVSPITIGYMHEGRSGWMIVEKVFDGKFNPGQGEPDGYFCKLRPATPEEVAAHLAPKPRMSDEDVEAAWERIAYIGS
jgi:hypothetical protein